MRLMWMSKRKAQLLGINEEDEAWSCIPSSNIEGELRYSKTNLQRAKEKKGQFDRLFEDIPGTSKQEGKKTTIDGD